MDPKKARRKTGKAGPTPHAVDAPRAAEVSVDRRDFLRLTGALAAAGALGSAACSPPQEATVPFHDMPESLVNGMGRARFFHTVIEKSPVAVPGA